jgi:cold shock CspA family protein
VFFSNAEDVLPFFAPIPVVSHDHQFGFTERFDIIFLTAGKIKKYRTSLGVKYGHIVQDEGEPPIIFFHINDFVVKPDTLHRGDVVEYEVESRPKGPIAVKIVIIEEFQGKKSLGPKELGKEHKKFLGIPIVNKSIVHRYNDVDPSTLVNILCDGDDLVEKSEQESSRDVGK